MSGRITDGKLEILGIYPKSEEIVHFYSIFLCAFAAFYSDYVEQNYHVLVMTFHNTYLALSTQNQRKT